MWNEGLTVRPGHGRIRFECGGLFVLAGPSGAGKTTLAHHLVDTFEGTVFSVSATTRPRRGSERDGVDYFFVTREDFLNRIREGYFLEHAEVHGHLYGTCGDWVRRQLASGRSVVLDIDVQGALQVKAAFPASVLVFILPPDPETLRGRLEKRDTDDPSVVDRRMDAAVRETGWIGSFDYFVRNDDLDSAGLQVESIFRARCLGLDDMAFPAEALALCPDIFSGIEYWEGRRVIVTSGPTREPVDDVRFVSNRSSGLMGRCLAQAFRDAGAEVLFVTGPSCHTPLCGVETIGIETAEDLMEVLLRETGGADLLAMAAAVSDFRPSSRAEGKLERSEGMTLELEPTPDILETLGDRIPDMCPVLAFALEFGPDGRTRAAEKMVRKGAEAVFHNPGDVEGSGMESGANQGELMFRDGSSLEVPRASKRYIAQILAAAMGRRLRT
ncbi:MAG: hypothetical protein AVO35_08200 [Candidatus Aegiribacteria sp. MLS_C]|nr:MAG: hypothetical protein AVO35_08200 [Candidatus Aegiribacteria sp. MLS_C]